MTTLPPQLQNPEFRFCLIHQGGKVPFQKAWQTITNYSILNPTFQKWLGTTQNHGVLGGYGNLMMFDCDVPNIYEKLVATLGESFAVKSGGRGLPHYYIVVTDAPKHVPGKFHDPDTKQVCGEVRWYGGQCVGAGSTHESGRKYEVLVDVPIRTIRYEQLAPFLHRPTYEKNINTQQIQPTMTKEEFYAHPLIKFVLENKIPKVLPDGTHTQRHSVWLKNLAALCCNANLTESELDDFGERINASFPDASVAPAYALKSWIRWFKQHEAQHG